KGKFWFCFVLFIFQAAWEIVLFTSVAAFLQSVLTDSNIYGGQFAGNKYFEHVFDLFQQVPEGKRVFVSFIFASFAVLMKSIIKIGIMTYTTKFSTRFIWQVRNNIFGSTLRNSMTFFDNRKKGALIQMIINETRSTYSVLKSFLALTIDSFMIIIYLFFMLSMSIKLSVIVFIASVTLFLLAHILAQRIKGYSAIVVKETRKLTVTTEEAIGGVKQLKLLNYYKHAEEDFSAASRNADFTNRKVALLVESQGVLTSLMGLITFSILLYLNWKGSILGLALFLTYLYIIRNLIASIASFNLKYSQLNKELPAVLNIKTAFEESIKYHESGRTFKKDRLLEDNITLKSVSMNYGKGDILKEISLEIKKAQKVAIVGESGSGKTSLINLLCRLYDINQGRLAIDGVDISEYDLNFLRHKIGVVNQDTILFNDTIKGNILMASPDATYEEIVSAAKKAFAHDFINELPHGYDTKVGDRGVKLSGGQRQRINIAQIFLKDPELLILDEATSSLDAKSEMHIQKSLHRLGENKTTITIAHRLSTVKNSDLVIVLDHGKIVEYGSWESLLANPGLFSDMVKQQSFTTN
ncbi:MAG TPA: ABC transporter ATP-binding protein, partial [Nitrospirae bacterium]|nr:ABC transporter ATP-binding protein [Nitrospirota bacterium]